MQFQNACLSSLQPPDEHPGNRRCPYIHVKPAVKDVTMGDALEYFQDLGLEYNVDYVDAGTKATGRREKASYGDDDITAAKFSEEDEEENKTIVEKKEEKKEEVTDDDNLFDLIDSMYQDQD